MSLGKSYFASIKSTLKAEPGWRCAHCDSVHVGLRTLPNVPCSGTNTEERWCLDCGELVRSDEIPMKQYGLPPVRAAA